MKIAVTINVAPPHLCHHHNDCYYKHVTMTTVIVLVVPPNLYLCILQLCLRLQQYLDVGFSCCIYSTHGFALSADLALQAIRLLLQLNQAASLQPNLIRQSRRSEIPCTVIRPNRRSVMPCIAEKIA